MKILSIRIKNLASLEGISEIDFRKEPLSSAGIFAITGPTGAGKSTLLDALCLALYTKTPRYLQARESGVEIQDVTGSKISQGDIRSILRDGTADGFAEVEFIGIDGITYRSTWSVRRARNKVDGSLQSDSIELLNLATNITFPGRKTETLKEIERLIGLNFDQFTRSVLLAQGEFTAFLKADKDSKSSLLEKLTGTDIYSDISKLIYEKYKEADLELGDLNRQIEGITIFTEEELTLLNQQKETLGEKAIEFNKQLGILLNEINWHNSFLELTAGKIKAEEEWMKAENEKVNAAERITDFTKIESIQPARSLIEAKINAVTLLDKKSQALDALVLSIHDLNGRYGAIEVKLKEVDKTVLGKQNESLNAQPAINEAKRLDTIIKEKNEQLTAIEQESVNAIQKRDNHLLLVQQKEKEITDEIEKKGQLENWKAENISRQSIAEHITLITSKLTDAGKLLGQQTIILDNISTTNSRIKKNTEDIPGFENKVTEQDKALGVLNEANQLKKSELLTIPIDALLVSESALIPSIEEVVSAKGHWELLFATLKEQKIVDEKWNRCKQDLISTTTELKEKNLKLQEVTVKRQQTDKLLSQAKLQTAEKVEDLRSQLVNGEECPVCGSTEHPFSNHNPQLSKVLEGLEKEYLECDELYKQLLGDTSSLQKLSEKLESDRLLLEKDIDANSGKVLSMEKKWESYNIDKRCFQLPIEERLPWLESHLETLRLNLKETKAKISSYNKIKSQVDLEKDQIDTLIKELHTSKDSLKDIKIELQNSNEELTRLNEQLNKSDTDIQEITSLLSPYFNKPTWIDNWKKDAVKFVQDIKSFSENWNRNNQEIETAKSNLSILQTALHGLQTQVEGLALDVKTKGSKLTELRDNLSLFVKQRANIFSGVEITIVEQRLKAAIDDAIVVQKKIVAEKDQLNSELTKANGNKEQLEQDKSSFNLAVEKSGDEIKLWINEFNSKNPQQLDEETITRLLNYTNEWIDIERKAINNINETITRTKATFEERSLQVATHEKKKLSVRSLEELAELNTDTKLNYDLAVNDKNEIEYKLRNDLENKKKIGDLLKEIESKSSVYENWSKLNDLLGSADGKKFRQIAQEYTLDILLGFANIHLQDLANRYKLLRIPGSLGLQILDKDMGDEVRTVFSLSGGESFLVSLALALGLASLSSNKMKVESLFIDEGFGSLDPATLNIAMDALERLHNQGRKVGVISHVQEMMERIPTQIKVSKLSNGKSKIELCII